MKVGNDYLCRYQPSSHTTPRNSRPLSWLPTRKFFMCFCLSGYHFFLPHNQSLQLISEVKSVPGLYASLLEDEG